MIGKAVKSKIVTFVSAIGLMMVGSAATTPTNAADAEQSIDFEIIPSDEPEMIDEIATLDYPMSSASTTRRLTTWPKSSASLPKAASSTWWVGVVVRGPNTFVHLKRLWTAVSRAR